MKRLSATMAPPKPSDRVSTVDVRNKLRLMRRRVQSGEIIPIYQYQDLIGYLVPARDAMAFEGTKSISYKLIDFREKLTSIVEEMFSGELICVYVTFHDTPVMAFIERETWEAIDRD